MQLKNEVNTLVSTAAEETKNLHRIRTEVDKLKSDKEIFLKQRQEEELLLLGETTRQLEEARKQVRLNQELAEREKITIADEWDKIRKEQQNLSASKYDLEEEKERLTAFLLRVGVEKDEAKKHLKEAHDAYQLGTKRASDAQKLLEDVKYRLERIDEERNALKSWEEKNRYRTTELSDRESNLQIREKEVEIKYNNAIQALAEAEKLVLWHKESQKT